CVWSWRGFTAAWATEKTLRQWTLANVLSAGLALWLPLAAGERALILALGLLVLAAELLNTAIEVVVDYISTERHPMAAKAKDCGSAGVALTALAAGAAWAVVLWGLWSG
ncbi:MAG: diacylglycerol kinase, partial [Rhodobacteraceae bacterium]|nr:diacylglycerol kinase [Paracoccaceae bacterium]